MGIPRDQQRHIFKSFKQQKRQKTKEFGGTGLGLAITRKLVFMMNGTISLDSEKGRGSVFEVRIPEVEIASADPADEKDPLPPSLQFETKRILVVDDIDFNRDLIVAYLEPFGFELIEAENGEEALSVIQNRLPDLILLDMKMPVMDGYEVMAVLARDPGLSAIPVIAVTASALAGEEEEISRLCNGYLKKPLSRSDLIKGLLPFIPHTRGSEFVPEANLDSPVDTPLFVSKETARFLDREMAMIPDLLDRMNLGDIEAFCIKLQRHGNGHAAPFLIEWGKKIHQAVQEFDSRKIIQTVDEFAHRVNIGKKRS